MSIAVVGAKGGASAGASRRDAAFGGSVSDGPAFGGSAFDGSVVDGSELAGSLARTSAAPGRFLGRRGFLVASLGAGVVAGVSVTGVGVNLCIV